MKRSTTIIAVGTVALTAALAALFATIAPSTSHHGNTRLLQGATSSDVETAFNKFISKNHRSYLTKEEYKARLESFTHNFQIVKGHDAVKEGYSLGLNQFADYTMDEFKNMLMAEQPPKDPLFDDDDEIEQGQNVASNSTDDSEPGLLGAPLSVDWRASGAVTTPKNQGKCAGCYTFSAASAVEGIYKIKTGTLPDLSPQQLIDCTTGHRNAGCEGGFMTNCYNYLRGSKLMRNSDYPYTGVVGSCKYNSAQGVTGVTGHVVLPKNNPSAILNAVAQQPVSVGMSGYCSAFMLYKGGILTKSCGIVLNHAVLIVGYGTDSATGYDFWIVKNSWGTGWGEGGYFRLLRKMTADGGISQINQLASYPTL